MKPNNDKKMVLTTIDEDYHGTNSNHGSQQSKQWLGSKRGSVPENSIEESSSQDEDSVEHERPPLDTSMHSMTKSSQAASRRSPPRAAS